MGAVYVAHFENVAVTAVQDLFEIATPSGHSARVRRFCITTNKLTSESLRVTMNRNSGAASSGSGGSTPAIRSVNTRNGTAQVTVEANNTSRVTGGTKETLMAWFWNIITPLEWVAADPEAQPVMGVSDHFTIGLESAPAVSQQFSGWIEWEEIGG
jgi:hypothetical protein